MITKMTEDEAFAIRFVARAESHLRDQMFLLNGVGYRFVQHLVDGINILFEAGWRIGNDN